MKNERWNIGDWVLCTNLEPPQEATVFAHHPQGEFVWVKTMDGKEYAYPESSDMLALIEQEKDYYVNVSEITDIDTFFLHVMASPESVSGFMARDTASRAMKLTNIKAKQSTCYFLTLAPKNELIKEWRQKAKYLANGCNSVRPMMKGFKHLRERNEGTPTESSDTLN